MVAGAPDADAEGLLRSGRAADGAAASAAVGPAGGVPALVEQRFGQGRVAALLLGDLWRWAIRRPENVEEAKDDLPKAWRQTVRWLVGEVPRRVEVTAEPAKTVAGAAGGEGDDAAGAMVLSVRVRDATYGALDNAAVTVRVTGPDGGTVDLTAEPSEKQPGLYEARFVPRNPGGYTAVAAALAPDGSEVGTAAAGWASDPAAEEFRDLRPNAALLERVAKGTGGQVVSAGELESFVAGLPTRHAEITEPYVRPVWHQPWVFLLAIVCLTAEWGLRRWKGLP
jgi:hypothetical protein